MRIGISDRGLRQNIIIRAAFAPIINIRRKIEELNYFKDNCSEKLEEIHNLFLGETCYIIGNGPSLRIEDLEMLDGKHTFASNDIHELFGQTTWRPEFYLCVDRKDIKHRRESLLLIEAGNLILGYPAKKYCGEKKKVYYLNVYEKFQANVRKLDKAVFSDDISYRVWGGKTVTFAAMQTAVYMGFKRMILLGVDNNYHRSINKDGRIITKQDVRDHVEGIKNYNYGIAYTDKMEESYRIAKEYCDNKGVEILNATRGGKLEVFKRISFEDYV